MIICLNIPKYYALLRCSYHGNSLHLQPVASSVANLHPHPALHTALHSALRAQFAQHAATPAARALAASSAMCSKNAALPASQPLCARSAHKAACLLLRSHSAAFRPVGLHLSNNILLQWDELPEAGRLEYFDGLGAEEQKGLW